MRVRDISTLVFGPAREADAAEGWRFDPGFLARTGACFVLFALMALVVREYRLESQTFYQVMLLAVAGYPLAALAPRRTALGLFALVSLASVGLAFGFVAGGWLIGIGLLIIAVAHVPLPFRWRIGLVLGIGLVVAAARVEVLPTGAPASIWPILGAMFMFRTALYLFSLRHRDAPFSLAHAIGYFFMLPNVSFPLFPVVDYKTFARGHHGGDLAGIHLTGLRWILRGLVHLMLYRYVYFHLVIDAHAVTSLGELAQYVLATYFLYLRVSGQFHVIAGILHLYGFRLPETHHLYYLATGFTDFWRRINIYWKDLMMKLVYYPSFFRLRRFGHRRAMVLATIPVFVATWVLHSYQWFWLRGDYPITVTDTLFWAILAVLVIVASVRELDPARRARARLPGWRLRRGLATLSTFVTMAVLWSMWSAESLRSWLDTWQAAGNASPGDVLWLGALAVGFVGVGGYPWGMKSLGPQPATAPSGSFFRPVLAQGLGIAVLLLIGTGASVERLPTVVAEALVSAKEFRLNRQDAALQLRGYYENLDHVNRFNTQTWQIGRPRRPDGPPNLSGTAVHRARTDWLTHDLRPDTTVVFLGKQLTINALGMRDQPYEQAKPAGTLRIALLGPSDVLGWGVADGETFESVAEGILNASAGEDHPSVQILNYGVHGYSLVQQLALFRDRVLTIDPDVVVVVSHFQMERVVLSDYLTKVSKGYTIPDSTLRSTIESARLTSAMTAEMRRRRLAGSVDSLVTWAFRTLHDEIVAHGALPVVLGLHPRGPDMDTSGMVPAAARAAGFPILDLTDVMQNLREDQVVSSTDLHPNASGHRLLGERFAEALASWQPGLFRGRTDPTAEVLSLDARRRALSPAGQVKE